MRSTQRHPLWSNERETCSSDRCIAVAEYTGSPDDPQIRTRRHAQFGSELIGRWSGHPAAHELLDRLEDTFDLLGGVHDQPRNLNDGVVPAD